jgi:magnesium-protoporphyrin IX monomethyl ester (oxidative) cyclase
VRNPHLLRGANLLWVRFFLLAVYATMYVRDHMRPQLHQAMGLDAETYDYEGVPTSRREISKQVFPLTLDTDSPRFRAGLSKLVDCSLAYSKAKARGGLVGRLQQAGHAARAAATFVGLYLHPVKRHDLPAQIRVAPSW